jgi:Peptidase family M1 domain
MSKLFLTTTIIFCQLLSLAQVNRWQQRVEYAINVSIDATNHGMKGDETITYYNNSDESLSNLYFHLYFNAFQPGSVMDVRSLTIEDPDQRVSDRISKLKPEEEGHCHVRSLKVNGKSAEIFENGTILEVKLAQPIQAHASAKIELVFDGQVPLQIRRSGRSNTEGIDYSMSQWYPKLCEYDYQGWHANPYVGREFHGVWGDFRVNITMPRTYVIGGTGILKNADEIGKGYVSEDKVKPMKGLLHTWKFEAINVHDFVWAADPDFVHDTYQVPNGPLLRFFYQKDQSYSPTWKEAQPLIAKAFEFLNKNFGVYPYSQYSIIQGGDGGMEYPMATLITGNRKLPSLVGVSVHEAAHSWYQGVLATNESLYCWMDEGFTSFATSETMDYLFKSGMPSGHASAYNDYVQITREGKEEALDTHADHYITNYAYGTAAYNKGEVYLAQLEHIIGTFHFRTGLLKYFDTWKFKHPNANDFLRIMEIQSGMELDWYNAYFVHSTKQIDYGIESLTSDGKTTTITLKRVGEMIMPVEVEVKYLNGEYQTFVIPLDIMRGAKPADGYNGKWSILTDWNWVDPTYTFEINIGSEKIERITIDSEKGTSDVNRKNNEIILTAGTTTVIRP